jgi:GntR family transcriptional repressor for pyruvate dehydrogenase complex
MGAGQLLKTVVKKSVVEDTLDQLYQLIKGKKLHRGDKLPTEREMAESLGISRSSLREALSSLQSMGVVKIVHGSGIIINDAVLSDSFLRPLKFFMVLEDIAPLELFESRLIIEGQCARLAAERATKEDLNELKEIFHEMELNAEDKKQGINLELLFHEKVADCARQKILLVMLMSIKELLRDTMQRTVPVLGVSKLTLDSHRELITTIEEKDGDAAEMCMRNHILSIKDRYIHTQNKE